MTAVLPPTLIKTRRSFAELGPLLERIGRTYRPADVVLFGSRAKGEAAPESDWDLMVILPDDADESLLDPVLGWETQAGSGVYADIVCALRSAFVADATVPNSLARQVVRDGIGVIPA